MLLIKTENTDIDGPPSFKLTFVFFVIIFHFKQSFSEPKSETFVIYDRQNI